MDLNPYRAAKFQDSEFAPGTDRNFASNLVGISLVIGIWYFWLRTFDDGEFFGWLVLGASVGVFVDGIIGKRQFLTPINLFVIPFFVGFILANHAMFPLLANAELGAVSIACAVFWMETMIPVGIMLLASSLARPYVG